MALGFQSGAFQSPGFQGGGGASAGSARGGRDKQPDYDWQTRNEIERERRRRRISEQASDVIEQVAQEQALRDELDGIAAAAELAAAMERSDLKWRAAYESALESYREIMRAAAAGLAREKAQRLENERRDAVSRHAAVALLLLNEH